MRLKGPDLQTGYRKYTWFGCTGFSFRALLAGVTTQFKLLWLLFVSTSLIFGVGAMVSYQYGVKANTLVVSKHRQGRTGYWFDGIVAWLMGGLIHLHTVCTFWEQPRHFVFLQRPYLL